VILLPDPWLRTYKAGRVLVGGTPRRVISLTETGAEMVRSWFRGEPVSPEAGAKALAARLLNAGMAHPRPNGLPTADLGVVIPVKDDVDGLRQTLQALDFHRVTVVDDGSLHPARIRKTAKQVPLPPESRPLLIRHNRAGGPAAARNTGWLALADSEVVAFVDAGVEIAGSELEILTGHFNDPSVIAVAPRVSSTAGESRLERYEQLFSPLDMGSSAGPVGPGRQLGYVPSACLLVRAETLLAVGGFAETFRFGEDVDLVWRLASEGAIRYDPTIEANHRPRPTWNAWIRQRYQYGTSASQLSLRHGKLVAPWRASPASACVIGLLLAGHPVLGAGIAALPIRRLANQLGPVPQPYAEATRLVLEGHLAAARSFAENAGRTWWPLTAAVVGLGAARPLLLFAAAGWGRRLSKTFDPANLAIGILDDLSYGTGVWIGAFRRRAWRAVAPHIRF